MDRPQGGAMDRVSFMASLKKKEKVNRKIEEKKRKLGLSATFIQRSWGA